MTVATELRRAMSDRGVNGKQLAAIVGVRATTVSGWLHGQVPLLRHSQAIADALCCPRLADVIREARTTPCPVCGRLRVHGSNMGRYCGRRCQHTAEQRRRRDVRGRQDVLAQHRLKVFGDAIDELCRRWCEPAGLCRDATCPVQAAGLSPLPLATGRRRVA